MTSESRTALTQSSVSRYSGPNWRNVGIYVGLVMVTTLALDLWLYFGVGYSSPAAMVVLCFQMLIPACCAILLERTLFRDATSPVSIGRDTSWWFMSYALAVAAVYLVLSIMSVSKPDQAGVFYQIGVVFGALGLVMLLVLRRGQGATELAAKGLHWGQTRFWLFFGVGLVLFYSAETALNALFGLGSRPDLPLPEGLSRSALVAIMTAQTLLLNPFLGLLVAFGEEYGWRGYLQTELVKMGKRRGILVLGIVWGLWHAPIIVMGHNFPGHPVLGVFLMTVYSVLLGFILGYAVLKSGSIILAAFLHALNNGFGAYLNAAWNTPADPALSFFAGGLYGLPLLAIIVMIILRDPVWADEDMAASGMADASP